MDLQWTRSSFCGTGACVQVIREGDVVVVRDGKFGDYSVKQTFSAKRWQELIAALAGGRDYPDVLDVDDRVYLGRVVPLCFTAEEWTAFVKGVKAGEFNYDRLSTPSPDSARQVPEEAATGAGEDTSTSPAARCSSLPDPAPVAAPDVFVGHYRSAELLLEDLELADPENIGLLAHLHTQLAHIETMGRLIEAFESLMAPAPVPMAPLDDADGPLRLGAAPLVPVDENTGAQR